MDYLSWRITFQSAEHAARSAFAAVERIAAENAMLRRGDTCARQCEGTAYRIEARRLRAALKRLATAIGELPDWESDELHKAYAEAMALMPPNVEFSGGAPLHGAASAGTKGYASGDKNE